MGGTSTNEKEDVCSFQRGGAVTEADMPGKSQGRWAGSSVSGRLAQGTNAGAERVRRVTLGLVQTERGTVCRSRSRYMGLLPLLALGLGVGVGLGAYVPSYGQPNRSPIRVTIRLPSVRASPPAGGVEP